MPTPIADPKCRPQMPTPNADPNCRPQVTTNTCLGANKTKIFPWDNLKNHIFFIFVSKKKTRKKIKKKILKKHRKKKFKKKLKLFNDALLNHVRHFSRASLFTCVTFHVRHFSSASLLVTLKTGLVKNRYQP